MDIIIKKKYIQGLNWNPNLTAPLNTAWYRCKTRSIFTCRVNGIPLDAKIKVYSLFQNTAGTNKQNYGE
jgi:hypothetical protein